MIDACSVILKVAGGLGLFLLGMEHLSEGLQAVSGNRLRKMVAAATNNRLAGVLTGTTVTGIIQSSSIVTVMVVGLVSTGLMTLTQAINVIIGANIGTTATAWLIASVPSAEHIGLGIIAVSSAIHLFSRNERTRNASLACLGIGLIFFGLDLMKAGMSPIAKHEGVKEMFAQFHAGDAVGLMKCIAASMIFTAVIQSSSATTAITMTLAQQGLISFESAAASVLGMNIGTTITAWLASLGATTEAKRAALAHTLFNLIGVLIVTPFFLPVILPHVKALFPDLLTPVVVDGVTTFPHVATPMACIHTGFNVLNTCLFLPFIPAFARLVTLLIPAKPGKDVTHLTVLDPRMISTPTLAIEQAFQEVLFMADSDLDLLTTFRRLLEGEKDTELATHIRHREDILDNIQREVTVFIGQIMTGRLPQEVALRAQILLRVTDEYESISDEVASLLKMLRRLKDNTLEVSPQGREELLRVHDHVTRLAVSVNEAVKTDNPETAADLLTHMRADASDIRTLIKQTREAHLQRLASHPANAMKIVVYMDMLNAYTRIKEELINIGETLSGGK